MAGQDDGAERSQEPTEKRKEDAREEGRVLTSKEAMVFAGFAAGTGLIAAAPAWMPPLVARFAGYFVLAPAADLPGLTSARIVGAFWQMLGLSVAAALPLALAIVGLQAMLGGVHFAPKALGFKTDKINPLSGLKRMVSAAALVELVKALVKVAALGVTALVMLQGMLPAMDKLWSVTAAEAGAVMGDGLLRLMAGLTVVLLVVGGLDVAWQWLTLRKGLMMTLQEVKEESKEQNGSPEVKGRMRQLQMEASRRAARERRALSDVPRATAVVTNPTHFAVAIRYVPGDTRAPVIVAMGKGPVAAEIRDRARKAGIAQLRIPLLARALYFTGDIGAEIAEGLYAAVAAVLAHVYRLDRGEAGMVPDVDLPPELRFDEHGRRAD